MSKMDLHDRTFTFCMTDPRLARQFFEQYLPIDLLHKIDLSTLILQKDMHIDVKLRKSVTDMVYSVQMGDSLVYLYLLIEHKSKPEQLIPLQMMRYVLAIMHDHTLKYQTNELPVVYPILFYHGRTSPYPYAVQLDALFNEEHKELGKDYLLKPINIIDLGQIADEELREYTWSGLMSFVMKHRYSQDIALRLKTMHNAINEMLMLGESDVFTVLLNYIFSTVNVEQYNQIIENLKDMSEQGGDMGMTIAQFLRKEGRQEGRQEGHIEGFYEGKRQIAQRMLREGMDISLVSRLTELPEESLTHE